MPASEIAAGVSVTRSGVLGLAAFGLRASGSRGQAPAGALPRHDHPATDRSKSGDEHAKA